MASASGDPGAIVELNVGGQVYVTRRGTLRRVPGSRLDEIAGAGAASPPARDAKGRLFLDRDGFLFRYVLDFLRDGGRLALPERFPERRRLRREAEYFRLPALARLLGSGQSEDADEEEEEEEDEEEEEEDPPPGAAGSYLALACCPASPGGGAGKPRLSVSGARSLAEEVFGNALQRGRAPRRYVSRRALALSSREEALDRLAGAGFRMVGCHAAGGAGRGAEYLFSRPSAGGGDSPEASGGRPDFPGDLVSDPEKTFRKAPGAAAREPVPEPEKEEDGVPGKNTGTPPPDHLRSPEAPPDGGPPSEAGSPGSLPWPEAPEETSPPTPTPPSRPTTLDFLPPPAKEAEPGRENGPEGGGPRGALRSELGKCIEDFRKIKLPLAFPDKKRQWQSQLLEKYQL